MKNILFLLAIACCLGAATTQAQDTYLKYQSGDNELRFRLLDDGTLGLVSNPDHLYTGDVVVPAAVMIDNTAYKVTALCGGGEEIYGEGSDASSAFNSTSINSEGITSISLPEGLLYIANSALHTVPIKELKIPSTVQHIGQMFSMNELKSFTVPDGVETIISYNFYIFRNLESLTVGTGVKTIQRHALVNCNSLKRIYFMPEVPPTLIQDPFDQIGFWNLADVTAYVPAGCIEAYKNAWPDFEFTYVEMGAGVDNVNADESIQARYADNAIHLSGITRSTAVGLYDILGRTILNRTVDADCSIPVELRSNQIYILKTGNKCTKLIIK